MRILHLLNDISDAGNGIVNAAIDLASGQVANGHTVAIASNGGGMADLLTIAGIQWIELSIQRNPISVISSLYRFNRIITTFHPDVVHAHMRTGLVFGWLFSKLRSFPLVGHVHNVHEGNSILMGAADRVIVVSQSVGDTLCAKGLKRNRVRTVLNGPLGGPRLARMNAHPAANLIHPCIVTVAGMNVRKGIEELLNAFAVVATTNQAVHLYLVGGGPDSRKFEQQANLLFCADRIHFMGRSTHPQSFMKSADIFVLASRRDSFPLVLAEARNVGCPIIASDVDGIPEALDFGRAGLLFQPQNVAELTSHIIHFLADQSERDLFTARAKEGLDRFHYQVFASRVDEVYSELVK